MSKSLEALEHLVDGNLNEVNYYRQFANSTIAIMKDKETIEKELKAFQIAVKYRLDLEEVYHKDYEWFMLDHKEDDIGFIPNKEEYDLVKEIVDNE